jgi:small GTP-binding protein
MGTTNRLTEGASVSNTMTSSALTLSTTSVKVVLLGDSGVGKSSLVCRFVHGTFHPFLEPTIGAAFLSQTLAVKHNTRRVLLKLWDTAGQERFQSLTPLYFRGAQAAILVYDVCRLHSFETLKRWIRELPELPAILVVVGNKSDLAEHRSVLESTARSYAKTIDAFYIETSAKENVNVTELFQELAERAAEQLPVDALQESTDRVDLGIRNDTKGCCL